MIRTMMYGTTVCLELVFQLIGGFCIQKLIVMIILKKWEELVFRSLIIIKRAILEVCTVLYSRQDKN